PDALVRAVLDGLAPPGEGRARGLLHLLERYRSRHGGRSAELLAAEITRQGGDGDLAALCLGLVATDDGTGGESQRRAYRAWCDGALPAKKHRNPAVRRALTERTAQRSLNDLTRIVRALGHRGTLIVLSEGDALASRTERQREKGYTVLRELVDNFDASGGAVATRLLLTGQAALFEGAASLRSIVPLGTRLARSAA